MITDLLKDLIRLDSSNPPGKEEEIASFIRDYLSQKGIPSQLTSFAPGRPSLSATIEGREDGSIILSGHLDTVSPSSSWSYDPFSPYEKDGKIYGLGATDMKGGVACLLEAFLQAKERGIPRYSIMLLLSADEEDKYRGAEALRMANNLKDALFVIVAEPTNNIPLIGEKSELWVRTHFKGKEAHGSTPQEGLNAILAQVSFISELVKWIETLPPHPVLGKASLNVGKLNGGRQVNIVPEYASSELDFRLTSEEEKEQVLSYIDELGRKTYSGAEFSWEIMSYKRSLLSPHSVLTDKFLKVVEGKQGPQKPAAASYCTDFPTLFPQEYPPFVIFGPGDIRQAHQPDEFIRIDSLMDALRTINDFLLEIEK